MEMILGAMVLAGLIATAYRAGSDGNEIRRKAADAGAWDFLDRDAARRDARRQARRELWAGIRQRRSRQAGGDGTYQPGMGAYLGDVYRGWWADQAAKREAKRAVRPDPVYVFDPETGKVRRDGPTGPSLKDRVNAFMDRADAAIVAKASRLRDSRPVRALIDPVGEKPAEEPAPDPWAFSEPTAEPTQPAAESRTPDPACWCGAAAVDGPYCARHDYRTPPEDRALYDGQPYEDLTGVPADLDHRSCDKCGAPLKPEPGSQHFGADGGAQVSTRCSGCGDVHSATSWHWTEKPPSEDPDNPDGRDDDDPDTWADEVDSIKQGFEYELCSSCGKDLDEHTIGPDPLGHAHAWCRPTPEDEQEPTGDAMRWHPDAADNPDHQDDTSNPTPQPATGGTTMTAPTGEVNTYEQHKAELADQREQWRRQADLAAATQHAVAEAKAALNAQAEQARVTQAAAQAKADAVSGMDSETRAHAGTQVDAADANRLDAQFEALEEIESDAVAAAAAAEAGMASVDAEEANIDARYGDAANTVASDLGGDPSYLGTGGPTGGTVHADVDRLTAAIPHAHRDTSASAVAESSRGGGQPYNGIRAHIERDSPGYAQACRDRGLDPADQPDLMLHDMHRVAGRH